MRKNSLEARKHHHYESAMLSSRLIVVFTLVCPIKRLVLSFSGPCPVAMTAVAIPVHSGNTPAGVRQAPGVFAENGR